MKISELYPNHLWTAFEKICEIPHPSKKEAQIIEFAKKFGEDLNLETLVDGVGNVLIRKPATPGMENRKTVVLQGHLDMVPQKNSDTNHDFEKDSIKAFIDGDWVTAEGTTLGADNGIGVAAAMAVLQSTDVEHGPIEALFTIDEETGMTGAFELKPNWLKGDILMNLDSEDEGELYIGCAGGMDANVSMTYTEENCPSGYQAYKLEVKGLKGGHSGMDIPLGRGNSNKLLNRFLTHAIEKHNLRIAEIEGGSLRNAIPRESFATIVIPESGITEFEACITKYEETYKSELELVEPELSFKALKTELPAKVMEEKIQKNFVNLVYGIPHGVIRMSDAMPGVVETSINLAIVSVKNGKISISCLMRSAVDSAKHNLAAQIKSICDLACADVVFEGEYPGWKPNAESPILKTMKEVYNNKYGKIPEVKVIHAGLECGILGAAYPNWDMISFGPTIRFPHSPDEKVKIETVGKFWDFLVETLKNVPVK
ncbi:MAG: cytosol nonspecific dipeptidase [Marinilabiliales bacterium]|nr:MAG: cytosol nonspecific dipeptidase [Marinilabiliales bacterium]